jgi:hypothetical protein
VTAVLVEVRSRTNTSATTTITGIEEFVADRPDQDRHLLCQHRVRCSALGVGTSPSTAPATPNSFRSRPP